MRQGCFLPAAGLSELSDRVGFPCSHQATHNVHHCVVNSVDHDPDVQHMPFLAISPEFVRGEGVYSRYHMARLRHGRV